MTKYSQYLYLQNLIQTSALLSFYENTRKLQTGKTITGLMPWHMPFIWEHYCGIIKMISRLQLEGPRQKFINEYSIYFRSENMTIFIKQVILKSRTLMISTYMTLTLS